MVKRVIIRDKGDSIVSILYIEEDSKLNYRQSFNVEGTRLMSVELYLEDNFIGAVYCWNGRVEEAEMVRDENGVLVEKEV